MKLSIQEKIGYGLGDTASNFVWALMMNFIMFFYTDIFGITAVVCVVGALAALLISDSSRRDELDTPPAARSGGALKR